MKDNKMIFLCILIFLCTSLDTVTDAAEPQFNALLIAHGSANSAHNQKTFDLNTRIMSLPAPNPSLSSLEVAFLGNSTQGKLGDALNKFNRSGKKQILLIPLSPCSYIRHDQIEPLARERANALGMTFQFKLAPAMDDHPLASEIIKEHAKQLSQDPSHECLLLFAYGPVEELENITWLRKLEQMGKTIGVELGFKEVVCATVRNHSPDLIAEQSIIDLRRKARTLKEKGRVIVVPYIFEDGPYEELQSYLSGIAPPQDIANVGFISNPKIDNWVREVIKTGMNQPQVKSVNSHWSTQNGPRGKF